MFKMALALQLPRQSPIPSDIRPRPLLFSHSLRSLSPIVPRFLLKGDPPRSFFERFEVLRVLLVVFLVIRLGRIKFHRRQNFRDDWFIEFPRVRELIL